MLNLWALCKSVRQTRSTRTIVIRCLAPARYRKTPGVPSGRPLQLPREVPRSSDSSWARRALLLLLSLVGLLVLCWPSSTLARTGTTAPSAATADPTPAGPYVVGGLILAGLLVALYGTLRAVARHEWPDIGHIVGIVAPTTAITAGVRLAVVAISASNLGPFESEDRVFIPLAGLALVLVSARAIYDVMRSGCLTQAG